MFLLSLQAFSQDKSIYEAVENAFISIYIRKNPVDTAKQLLNLAIDSNIGDQAALEFIVNALVSKGEISSSTVGSFCDSAYENAMNYSLDMCSLLMHCQEQLKIIMSVVIDY